MSAALEIHRHSEIETTEQPKQSVEAMTPMQMAYRLLESGIDLGSVKEMLAVSKELAADQARMAFSTAVAAAKAELKPVAKNRDGHNTRYADFSAIAKAVDPIISQFGLSYRFRTTQTDRINVTCILEHKEGHYEEITLSGGPDKSGSKNEIQALGSTLTYLQRYSLIQALGLAVSDDDDGRSHGGKEAVRITAEQRDRILTLLDETNSDIDRFCSMGKIDSVQDMLAVDYDDAVRLLEAKKGKMAQ